LAFLVRRHTDEDDRHHAELLLGARLTSHSGGAIAYVLTHTSA
jgi:hypothetical protein